MIGSAFRRAFAACAARSLGDAVDVAADWAVWAVDRGSTEEAAEAHWCLTRALLCRSRQERLSAEGEPRLSDTQLLAAQAGYWLLEAGRARDAAVAMDHGRARQLSERLHEPRERRLEDRLEEAQRFDLRDRWLQAIGETSPLAGAATITASSRSVGAASASAGSGSRWRSARTTPRRWRPTSGCCARSAGSPDSTTSTSPRRTRICARPRRTVRSSTSPRRRRAGSPSSSPAMAPSRSSSGCRA